MAAISPRRAPSRWASSANTAANSANGPTVRRQRFARLEARLGLLKAIVARARKLLLVIWHVLPKQAPDQHADVGAVTRSFQRWGHRHARQQ
jgi:hypothetical protein